MLTRKDYNVIADILESYNGTSGIDNLTFLDMVEDFADFFASDNPNFDYAIFREKCGIVEVNA